MTEDLVANMCYLRINHCGKCEHVFSRKIMYCDKGELGFVCLKKKTDPNVIINKLTTGSIVVNENGTALMDMSDVMDTKEYANVITGHTC